MKWKAKEVAVIVLNEYYFITCLLNESLFFLIGWTCLLGSVRTHTYTFSNIPQSFHSSASARADLMPLWQAS